MAAPASSQLLAAQASFCRRVLRFAPGQRGVVANGRVSAAGAVAARVPGADPCVHESCALQLPECLVLTPACTELCAAAALVPAADPCVHGPAERGVCAV